MSGEQTIMYPKVDYSDLQQVKDLAQACTNGTGTQHDVITVDGGKYQVMITDCRGLTHNGKDVMFTTVKSKNN